MSNYSSTPSMEEILSRIKTALAEREQKVHAEKFNINNSFSDRNENQNLNYNNIYAENNIANYNTASSSFNKNDSASITNSSNFQDQEIYLNEMSVKPNLQQDDVFILTSDMKINESQKFYNQVKNNNLSPKNKKVLHIVAITMANDLNMPFNASKIEAWLNQNFDSIYKELE